VPTTPTSKTNALTEKSVDIVPTGVQTALAQATLPRRDPNVPARVCATADGDGGERVPVAAERKCAAVRAGRPRDEGRAGRPPPAAAS